jgi:hypothetical protein
MSLESGSTGRFRLVDPPGRALKATESQMLFRLLFVHAEEPSLLFVHA